jgi:hypothetical protein
MPLRPAAVAFAMLIAGARAADAQWVPDSIIRAPVTAAGAHALHWTMDEGIGEQTVYVKNTSRDRTVTVAAWRVRDCVNLRVRDCGKRKAGVSVAPGQTIRLGTVRRDVAEREYFFRYELTIEWTGDTETAERR